MEKILTGIKARKKALELQALAKKEVAKTKLVYNRNESEMFVIVEFCNYFYMNYLNIELNICDIYIINDEEYKAFTDPIKNSLIVNDLKFGGF